MAGSRTFKVIFDGDTKGLGSAVDEAGGKMGKLGSAMGSVASIAGGFVLGQGILKLPGFLTSAAQGAAEDQASTDRLNQTLENHIRLAGLDSDALGELQGDVNDRIAGAQKLAFTDDEYRDTLQYLLNATDDYGEATKRASLAMDLARGANIPLSQASKLLGKINEDNVNTFKKLGIELPKTATEADALAAVQARFGGQADAYAKSTAGQFAQAKIALGEIVEGIGGAVLPIFTKLGTTLAANLPAIQEFVGTMGEKVSQVVAPALEKVGDIAGQLVSFFVANVIPVLSDFWTDDVAPKVAIARDIIGQLATKVGELATAVADRLKGPLTEVLEFIGSHKEILAAAAIVIGGALTAAFLAWAAAAAAAAAATIIALAPVIAIGLALTALVAVILLVIQNWDEITAKFPALGTAASAVKTALDAFTSWISGTFVPKTLDIYNAIKEAIDKAVSYVREHWDDIKAIIEPALKALVVIIETQVALWKTAIETALGVIKGIVDVFMGVFTGDWDRAWGGVQKIFESLWNGLKNTVQIAVDALRDLLPIIGTAGEALGKALVSAIWTGLGDLWQLGADVIKWILQGLKDMAWSIEQWAASFASSLASKLNPKNIIEGAISGAGGFVGSVLGQSGGGASQIPSSGGMGQPSSSYVDPRGVTLTADDILNMRESSAFGSDPVPKVVINIGTANMRDPDTATRTLITAARAAGLA